MRRLLPARLGIRQRFMATAALLMAAAVAANLLTLALFRHAVNDVGSRHLTEIGSLSDAIALTNLAALIDDRAGTMLTAGTAEALRAAYGSLVEEVAAVEQAVRGPPGSTADVAVFPVLSTLQRIRNAGALLYASRLTALAHGPVDETFAEGYRTTFRESAAALIDYSRSRTQRTMQSANRSADALGAALRQSQLGVALLTSVILLLLYVGYRYVMVRGLMDRLAVIQKSMGLDLDRPGRPQVPVTGSDELAAMARVLEDLMERARSLNEARATLSETQRIARLGHWRWVPERGLIDVSASLYDILGLPEGTPVTRRRALALFDRAARRDLARLAGRVRRDGSRQQCEQRIRRPDGRVLWLHLELMPEGAVPSGGPPDGSASGFGLFGIAQDITERHQARAEVDLARQQAEQASRAKSEFLASMSHELRTPMNAILGFAQLLLWNEKTEPLTAKQREQVEIIVRSGTHLMTLITDVLDLAKVEAGEVRIAMAPILLGTLLRDIEHTLGPMARARGVALSVPPSRFADTAVYGDEARLLQVLINLGSNAIKYNRPGGAMRIEVEAASADPGGGGDWLRIVVIDEGRGIPADRQMEVFQPFNRLGAERGTIEGTGIGLSISHKLMQLMGGRIGFDSEVGRGSRFWVELPPAAEEEPAVRAGAGPAAISG